MKSTLQASAITHHDEDKHEEQSLCSLLRCSKPMLIVYKDSIPLPNTDAIPEEEDAVSQIAVGWFSGAEFHTHDEALVTKLPQQRISLNFILPFIPHPHCLRS